MKRLFVVFAVFCALQSAAAGAAFFTDNGNGTVTDRLTGLVWQKEDDNTTRNWTDAGTYCSSLTLGGLSGWRLPSKDELMSIIDYSIPSPGPTINKIYFPNTNADYYWSSTTYASSTHYTYNAWFVNFFMGEANQSYMYYYYFARCVRSGQSFGAVQNNCAASVSSINVVHIPIVTFSGSNYWADLQYDSDNSTLTLTEADAVTDMSSYSSCTASTLSSDFTLHIPVVMIGDVSYWVDLQWSDSAFVVAGGEKN